MNFCRKVKKKEAVSWMLTGLWAGVIRGLSSIPGQALPRFGFDFPFSEAAHFLLYFALAGFLSAALSETFPKLSFPGLFSLVTLICVLYGVVDEIHQFFVPGRLSSARDVFIDGLGAFGLLSARRLRLRMLKPESPKLIPALSRRHLF
jgi:VanZ family protein